MSQNRIAAVVVAVALGLIGFAIGQYVPSPSHPAEPRPKTPKYSGPPPQAKFETPVGPAIAGPKLRSAEPREAVLDVLRGVLREPDEFARASRLAALLPALGPEAVSEVRAALEDPLIERGAVENGLLARFWAGYDPGGAVIWAMTRAPVGYRSGAFDAIFETWAKVDPQAAAEQLRGISILKGEGLIAAEIAIVRGWFESGRPGLEGFIRDLGTSIEQQRALSVFARRAIQRDGPEPIARWAESIPNEDENFKRDAFRKLGSELALADPAAARAWCEAHCDGPFGNNVRTLIAERWAARHGRDAMEWVSGAPAGEERDSAVRGAFRGWSRRDPEDLLSWVNEMGFDGVEPWFQPAVELLAIWEGAKDPMRGFRWAAAMTDDAARERTTVTIARQWRSRDPSAADAWLDQSPLSEEARERVRAPAKVPQRRRRARGPDSPLPPQHAPVDTP